jgi:hypothetical protein
MVASDHRKAVFYIDLMLVPMMVRLAVQFYQGKPYGLGIWNTPFLRDLYSKEELKEWFDIKLDSSVLVGKVLQRFRKTGTSPAYFFSLMSLISNSLQANIFSSWSSREDAPQHIGFAGRAQGSRRMSIRARAETLAGVPLPCRG